MQSEEIIWEDQTEVFKTFLQAAVASRISSISMRSSLVSMSIAPSVLNSRVLEFDPLVLTRWDERNHSQNIIHVTSNNYVRQFFCSKVFDDLFLQVYCCLTKFFFFDMKLRCPSSKSLIASLDSKPSLSKAQPSYILALPLFVSLTGGAWTIKRRNCYPNIWFKVLFRLCSYEKVYVNLDLRIVHLHCVKQRMG